MRHKCYQIDDFASRYFEEGASLIIKDADGEPIDKILKYREFSRKIKYQTRIKLNDIFFQKPPLYKKKFWKGKIYYKKLKYNIS